MICMIYMRYYITEVIAYPCVLLLYICNKESTNLLVAILVDPHAPNANEKEIEEERGRENENVKGKPPPLLPLAVVYKVIPR